MSSFQSVITKIGSFSNIPSGYLPVYSCYFTSSLRHKEKGQMQVMFLDVIELECAVGPCSPFFFFWLQFNILIPHETGHRLVQYHHPGVMYNITVSTPPLKDT